MSRQLLALATSVLTLVGLWLAGNHRRAGWLVGLGNQVLWLAFIVSFGAWGLLPLNVALTIVYSRNWWRWRQEQREETPVGAATDGGSLHRR